MTSTISDPLEPLESGVVHAFADWSAVDPPVSAVARGVYAIWMGEALLYIGVAGLGPWPDKKPKDLWGLARRLDAHAQGRRCRDQLTCIVADRFVLPSLSDDVRAAIAAGEESFDRLIRTWVAEHLTFRFIEVETTAVAQDLEHRARRGEMSVGQPLLNAFGEPPPASEVGPAPASTTEAEPLGPPGSGAPMGEVESATDEVEAPAEV